MNKKKKRKDTCKRGRKRKNAVSIKQKPVNPIRQRLEEINRLKPFVERAREIAQMEKVQESMKGVVEK
ncbi:hypothetical protein KQI42_09840 [Tissierella sp. MSJ-40]|uniref:Uncharacterized protein n=1 Tax=Tissierella simiarum TaxID=2841534 RepID=A0ABS6E648_9FIRM|nr:hypothetical protein [Tissierella simiarum]MBU5438311.1 hypothetical protein [Tissierella simiarum]